MRHRHISDIVISATLMLMLFSGPAAAQNVGEVPDIQSPGHNSEIPSRVSRTDVTWGIPEGDPYGYFVLFNTNPGHTFDGLNPDGEHVTRRSFTSPDFATSRPDDVAYYFHIAAADGKGEIGSTVTAGPYRIDVVRQAGFPTFLCASAGDIKWGNAFFPSPQVQGSPKSVIIRKYFIHLHRIHGFPAKPYNQLKRNQISAF
ncbi:MAG TPA: hypothetical protein ENK58_10020 [Desulfobacterales bacterium]|nr:hypothetical protein [Desulfobacterales bacterium]